MRCTPLRFGHTAQITRITRGIQVIGIVHAVLRQVGKAVFFGGAQLQAVLAVTLRQAALAALQPKVLKARAPMVLAGQTEGVDVVLAGRLPAFKLECPA